MIHEGLPTLTETAFGSHPCCVVSVAYVRTYYFHGGDRVRIREAANVAHENELR